MARTRRALRLDDDPRTPRKNRQKSGVNLMHEEPWFGFNVADKMPHKGDLDPAAVEFTGLPRGTIANNAIGTAEIDALVIEATHQKDDSTTTRVLASNIHSNDPLSGANQADDVDRAVNGDAIKTLTIDGYHAKDNAFGGRPIASNIHGNDPLGNANTNDDANRAISGSHIKTLTIQSYHLADNSVGKRALSVGINDLPGTLSYHSLSHRPNLSKFLTGKDIENMATHAWVKAYVTKHVKPTARR